MKTQEQTEATTAFASVKNHPLDQYWIDHISKQIEQATAELREENERLRDLADKAIYLAARYAPDCISCGLEKGSVCPFGYPGCELADALLYGDLHPDVKDAVDAKLGLKEAIGDDER